MLLFQTNDHRCSIFTFTRLGSLSALTFNPEHPPTRLCCIVISFPVGGTDIVFVSFASASSTPAKQRGKGHGEVRQCNSQKTFQRMSVIFFLLFVSTAYHSTENSPHTTNTRATQQAPGYQTSQRLFKRVDFLRGEDVVYN